MARAGLLDHRKFKRLAHILGEPVPHCVGYLECLWQTAHQQRAAFIGDRIDIQLATQYPGSPEKITDALRDAGFLDVHDNQTYSVHDFYDNAPSYVRRALRKDRRASGAPVARHRFASGAEREVKGSEEKRSEGKKKAAAPPGSPRHIFDPLTVPIPAALESPPFRAAWAEWLNYRRDRRLSSREATIRKQLEMLSALGPARAIEAVHSSIRNGWQGLFEPTGNGKPKPGMFEGYDAFVSKGE